MHHVRKQEVVDKALTTESDQGLDTSLMHIVTCIKFLENCIKMFLREV